MASLNINSLLAHIDDLRVFIDNSNIETTIWKLVVRALG